MHSLLGAILPGGAGTTTRGTGTTDGTGTLVGVASASDGVPHGITIIIILIGVIIRIITIIMVLFGLVVADTSVAVGAMDSIMITVVVRQTVPMLYVATAGGITVCVLFVVMTGVRLLLHVAATRIVHQDVLWPEEIPEMRYARRMVTVDLPLVTRFLLMAVQVGIR